MNAYDLYARCSKMLARDDGNAMADRYVDLAIKHLDHQDGYAWLADQLRDERRRLRGRKPCLNPAYSSLAAYATDIFRGEER